MKKGDTVYLSGDVRDGDYLYGLKGTAVVIIDGAGLDSRWSYKVQTVGVPHDEFYVKESELTEVTP